MSLYLLAANPPSKARLRAIFGSTRNLRGPWGLCHRLNIPANQRDVDSAVEHFVQREDPRKVREMIFSLDALGDTALADSLMDCAEPPAGS